MRIIVTVAMTLGVLALGGLLFIGSGMYNMGADAPHWPLTHDMVSMLRDRSIARASAQLQLPDLEDSTLVLKGAGQYAAMCSGCHLSPGMTQSEIRSGLYPLPPNLSLARVDSKAAFWAIKHGIKMSAMPAWGASHDDATIWSMVAFLRKLPQMDAAKYKDIVAKAPPDEDMDMGSIRIIKIPSGQQARHAGCYAVPARVAAVPKMVTPLPNAGARSSGLGHRQATDVRHSTVAVESPDVPTDNDIAAQAAKHSEM